MRTAIRRFAAYVIVSSCSMLSGCPIPIYKVHVHNPPLARNVPRIVKGKTTLAQIIQFFGKPDIEADGPNAKANPQGHLMEEPGGSAKGAKALERSSPYSSIDDEHVVFLYIESRMQGVVHLSGSHNKLMLFINKKTGLVDEFAYREQFNAQ